MVYDPLFNNNVNSITDIDRNELYLSLKTQLTRKSWSGGGVPSGPSNLSLRSEPLFHIKSKMAATPINQQIQITRHCPCVGALILVLIWSQYLHPLQKCEQLRHFIEENPRWLPDELTHENRISRCTSWFMSNLRVNVRVDPNIYCWDDPNIYCWDKGNYVILPK